MFQILGLLNSNRLQQQIENKRKSINQNIARKKYRSFFNLLTTESQVQRR